jgi:ribonucleotide monophosphatase NagD (HAD superfamily)
MSKVYRVIFTGLLTKKEHFKSRISILGVSREDADKILEKAPVVLKEAESLEYIKKYARAIIKAGGKVDIISWNSENIMETESGIPGMSSFTQCPQCGHRQPKNELCVRCGFVLAQSQSL